MCFYWPTLSQKLGKEGSVVVLFEHVYREKVFAPSWFLLFLHIRHTWLFQIFKLNWISYKDNLSKTQNTVFKWLFHLLKEKKSSNTNWAYMCEKSNCPLSYSFKQNGPNWIYNWVELDLTQSGLIAAKHYISSNVKLAKKVSISSTVWRDQKKFHKRWERKKYIGLERVTKPFFMALAL